MKYIVCIADGMADYPNKEIANKTPLEVSETPNLDFVAKEGVLGLVKTVPDGFVPGSDVANMGIFGYEPELYYTGRAPIEAVSLGIDIPKGKIAFRCNFVSIVDNLMKDFTAGHITSNEALALIDELNRRLSTEKISFFSGVSYRNIALLDDDYLNLDCTPPHDITGKKLDGFLPKGKGCTDMLEIMAKAHEILINTEANKKRKSKGLPMASDIWLWGQGKTPNWPLFEEKYGLRGGVVTAVDLLKGMGKLAGFETPDIIGATGYVDTNYEAKIEAAFDILKRRDIVYIHIEAMDECGHQGDVGLKIKAIQDFDKLVMGPVLQYQKNNPGVSVLVMPDHPTPCELKTHTADAVPFGIVFEDSKNNSKLVFTEKEAESTKRFFSSSKELIKFFLR